MKKSIITALVMVLILIAAMPLFARTTYYFTGDSVFSIRDGVDFPAFISFYKDPERGTVTFNDTHLKLGGFASLAYQGFIYKLMRLRMPHCGIFKLIYEDRVFRAYGISAANVFF